MPSGPEIILTLKVLVAAVTVLFACAVAAILAGRRRLHGRLNTAFFVLTMTTVIGFEVLIRLGPGVTATFTEDQLRALRVHLAFAVPAAVVLPVMYWSGATRRRRLHLPLAAVFVVLWAGTFVTGLMLPHD